MSDQGPNEQRRPDRAALGVGIALALVGAIIIWSTYSQVVGFSPDPIGQKVYPYIIGAGFLGLSVLTVLEALRGDFPERPEQNWPPILWVIGGLAAQLLLLYYAGFSIATGLMFACTAHAFGEKRIWLTIPVGIVFAFIIWIIFAKGLGLGLPPGPIENLFFR